MLAELQGMSQSLDAILGSLDPARLQTVDAARLLEASAAVEQRACALKTLLAKRASESQVWANDGHRSPESWLAKTTGSSFGQAAGTLHASEKLAELPGLDKAVREGQLSGPQLNELASAATATNEQQLLDASKKQSFKQLRRTCANEKAKARSVEREEARHRRIHGERHHKSWFDAEGAYCYSGRNTAMVGARVEAALDAETDAVFKAARAEGRNEPLSAYRADALANLICSGGAKVDTTVVIRVDEARLRGEEGLCEAVATGAVPVSEAIGAILAGAFVKIVLFDGVDITRVSHHRRHVPEVLRTAIHERDGYTCVRPGCGATTRLQIHHWIVDYGKNG
ncbi:MAG: DUF222 domain-containing protein, partial [Acidimicrobiia bacterium]|nr:DUF222 domain-containing protein [Acidimicrobiia bacterium]